MSLQDVSFQTEYRSLSDNVTEEFFNPALNEAILYQRAVGFFSSTALVEISGGLLGLIKNGGKIQLVASPHLSQQDLEAMEKGYDDRKSIIREAIAREMLEPESIFQDERLNLLANLISQGYLDIKIAMTELDGVNGMYHEKMGIISDDMGHKIAFSGSMNESKTAISYNYETIDVFCSWTNDEKRVEGKAKAFQNIWNNQEPNMETLDFPDIKEAIIEKYQNKVIDLTAVGEKILETDTSLPTVGAYIPSHINLRDYQVEAIDKWEEAGYRGIFDMATGTGKTLTGLGAVARLSAHLQGKLAVFIVCPYQHLVEQWVEDIVAFGMKPIVAYGSSKQKDWKKRLSNGILDQKLGIKKKSFFCVVCTNATFSKEFIQGEIQKIRGDVLLLVDEAHNFGATSLQQTLTDKFAYRLALSATLHRHHDEVGTQALYTYFGQKCIEYDLDRAIEEGKLTKYKYYPVVVSLNEIELEKYKLLSNEITKCLTKDKKGNISVNERGKILLLQRARLVASAEEKIIKLQQKIIPYRKDKHLLIYCGATMMLADNQEVSEVVDEDIRQIDLVTSILGNDLGMSVAQFTSKEDAETRELLKERFSDGENLQALIAIKCLDEGVNIPKIKTAFILASTTNPKEYIQRRGRVLRRSEGKEFAEIYDFITLPRPLDHVSSLSEYEMKSDFALVKNELRRAEEFARICINVGTAEEILEEIKEVYGIEGRLLDEQEEISYE